MQHPCGTDGPEPKFAGVPAIRNRMVFNNNRRQTPAGGSDFWESGVIRPDLVLRDLSLILGGKPAERENSTTTNVWNNERPNPLAMLG